MSPYHGMSVFVTGAGGFIGSHLCERLLAAGAHVTAFLRYSSITSKGWLAQVDDHYSSLDLVWGDIRDGQTVLSLMPPDTDLVFHLAALGAIPHSGEAWRSYLDTNCHGLLNVLTAGAVHHVGRYVATSTSEVYGTPQQVPITELHRMHPQSLYAATKEAADALALSLARGLDYPIAILRPFNAYGPRQSMRAVLPTMLAQALWSDEIRVGNLAPTRDWTYVADLVDAFLAMGIAQEERVLGKVTQVGTGQEHSVEQALHLVQRITGTDKPVVAQDNRARAQGHEVERLVCDDTSARLRLDWKATTTLEEGLVRTMTWMEANPVMYRNRAEEYHR